MQIILKHKNWFELNNIQFPQEGAIRQLKQFVELAWQWNSKINITAAKSKEEIVTRHILDSLTALKCLSNNTQTVLDIGSGGGFPAIPLAITNPLTHFILVERVPKKCAFLNRAKRKLGLTNITVENFDLQDLTLKDKVTFAITRAVRVDSNLKSILISKGIEKIITFTSEKTNSEKTYSYNLIGESKNRYVNLSKL